LSKRTLVPLFVSDTKKQAHTHSLSATDALKMANLTSILEIIQWGWAHAQLKPFKWFHFDWAAASHKVSLRVYYSHQTNERTNERRTRKQIKRNV